MLRRLYDWTMKKAESRNALWFLAFVSFVEASFFPIPPDLLIIPMVLAAPKRAWLIALVATLSSVMGGMLGYAIGAFFHESLGAPLLQAMGKADAMAEFNTRFNEMGVWMVLTAGLTPLP